jgi:hypothetical protein
MAKTKTVETQDAKAKTIETKATQTNRKEKRDTKIPSREAEKTTASFNLERKINKIKIPVPLVELAKKSDVQKTNC